MDSSIACIRAAPPAAKVMALVPVILPPTPVSEPVLVIPVLVRFRPPEVTVSAPPIEPPVSGRYVPGAPVVRVVQSVPL